MSISQPISTHKKIKVFMEQQYPYSTIWEKNIVAIIRSYGARAISLLFCVCQDTESDSCEIEIGISQ